MYKLEILEKLKTWESENFEYVFIFEIFNFETW